MTKTNAMDAISTALATGGDHLGDVVWCTLDGVKVNRANLRQMLTAEGLPESIGLADITAEAALGKAVGSFREKGRGIFLRRKEKRGNEVLVVRQNGAAFDTTARLSVINGTLQVTREQVANGDTEDVLQEVSGAFYQHLQFATSAEVGSMVIGAVLGQCKGIRLKERGHVYWVPTVGGTDLRALKRVIDGLASSFLTVLPVHDTVEARAGLQHAAKASFQAELKEAFSELAEFAERGNVRPSTLERRLDEYKALRDKVDLYADILDTQRTQLHSELERATAKVREMLTSLENDSK